MSTVLDFKTRLRQLATHDHKHRLFGARLHKYEWGPCLSNDQINAMETLYGIQLPSQYREYLSSVGNGRIGPGYGLLPLKAPISPPAQQSRKMNFVLQDSHGTVVHSTKVDDIATNYDPSGTDNTSETSHPFSLQAPYRSITDEMWQVTIPMWDERLRVEHQQNKNRFLMIPFGRGVLKIADYGSGIYAVLVLNGDFRGQVWITDPNMGDYVPASMRTDLHDNSIKVELAYRKHVNPFTFFDWFDNWLTSAEREFV